MRLNLLLLFLVVFLFTNCNNSPQNVSTENIKTSADSIVIVKVPFKNSSNIIEYEIPVLKETEKKHGIQKRFYRHGSLYSRITYINGKREGIAYTYYPTTIGLEPVVWKEQPYENGVLQGTCKRFHDDGTLQAVYEYRNGNPGTGLKEYSKSGKLLKQPALILTSTKVSSGYYITARLSNNLKNVDFFNSKLEDGKFLPIGLKGMQVKDGLGEIVVNSSNTSVTITAVYSTRYRNKCLISKTIKL